ncbi:unnamed protein product [Durusdinium trenchii]|uniref:Reverse transcriptase domain-containing protein n=1 Tax=Durusdinium trenchii TaxID=1381693 RepID=A0ABP0LSE7_9DINO
MVVDAIHSSPTRDPAAIARKRASFLKKWTTRPAQLTKDEEELHSSLPKHRRLILRGKRILVLKEMLAELQYPDLSVADDILNGFDLVGTAGAEGVLPADFQPATLTVQDLEEQANKSNKAIMNSCKSSGSPLVDAELWQKTLEEEDKGWLQSLERVPLDGGRVSRRFAVVQSEKVRPIDNYSESQINSAVTITNKCTVDGVDTKPAKTCEFMKALRSRSKCSTLVGRSFDLKSAYRQLAVSDSDLKWARLAVYCPEEKATKCFQQYSLPFGAKSSVVALLRCARMLQWICLKLDLVTSCYFDDFICLSTPALSRSSELTFETLLDLLGWKFDETGEKSSAMGASISALGVIVDLEKSSEGVLTSHSAASLKGRLGFAEGQLFGRATRRLINELGQHALRPPKNNKLSESTKRALEMVADQVLTSAPRIADSDTGEVYYIFTDASFESETKSGGIGGVLINGNATVEQWFGDLVTKDFCKSFMAEEQKQAIGELESFAVLVALHLWGKILARKHVVIFLDNEGCRYLILKGYASNKNLQSIVHNIAKQEDFLTFADHLIRQATDTLKNWVQWRW